MAGDAAPAFAIRFRTRAAQWRTLVYKHIGLLEAYFDGEVDIDGDLGAMFALGMYSDFDSAEPAGRAAQPLARAAPLQRVEGRAPGTTRASTTASAADFYRLSGSTFR